MLLLCVLSSYVLGAVALFAASVLRAPAMSFDVATHPVQRKECEVIEFPFHRVNTTSEEFETRKAA